MGYIKPAEIPIFTGISLAQMLSERITEYFADPVHQKEFEEWRKKRADEKNGSSCDCGGSSVVDFQTNIVGRRNTRSTTS